VDHLQLATTCRSAGQTATRAAEQESTAPAALSQAAPEQVQTPVSAATQHFWLPAGAAHSAEVIPVGTSPSTVYLGPHSHSPPEGIVLQMKASQLQFNTPSSQQAPCSPAFFTTDVALQVASDPMSIPCWQKHPLGVIPHDGTPPLWPPAPAEAPPVPVAASWPKSMPLPAELLVMHATEAIARAQSRKPASNRPGTLVGHFLMASRVGDRTPLRNGPEQAAKILCRCRPHMPGRQPAICQTITAFRNDSGRQHFLRASVSMNRYAPSAGRHLLH
jgi:hypothetical protein